MKHLLPSSLGIIGTFLTVLFGWLLISSAAYEESTYLDVKQGSVELSNSGDEISQIIDYYITVEPKITGRITVDIFKNDKFLRTDTLSDRNVVKLASGGEYYYYKLTISGKKDHDIYQIEFKYDDQTVKKIIPITSTSMGIVNIESPLKQFKSGTPIGEIQCEEGLELTLKASDGSPICVKPETKQKLIERGWATDNIRKPIEIVSSQFELATFYTQPQLTSVILPNDVTIRIHLFSYMRDSSGNWNQVFDSAFDEVPKNFRIGIVEKSPDRIKEFVIYGKANLPDGIKAEISREEGYFVVYLTSGKSLSSGKYDLSVVSVDKTGLVIEMPLHVIAVKKTSTTTQDHIVRIDYGKGDWGIIFENIPEQEYWIREERRDPWPPMPILSITDDNIIPSVKEIIEAMWEPGGKYTPYEYDDNVLLKDSNRTLNLDPPKIMDWLKKVHNEQFGRNLDDSYSSYIRYDDKIYSFGFVVSD